MLALFHIVLSFVVHASDPGWACKISHRDPGMPGTYYLYCSQTMPNGVEVISAGRFVPDVPQASKVIL